MRKENGIITGLREALEYVKGNTEGSVIHDLQERVQWVAKLSKGNPGAINVLCETVHDFGWPTGHQLFAKLDLMNIRGPDIWIIYKDECECKLDKFVEHVMSKEKT